MKRWTAWSFVVAIVLVAFGATAALATASTAGQEAGEGPALSGVHDGLARLHDGLARLEEAMTRDAPDVAHIRAERRAMAATLADIHRSLQRLHQSIARGEAGRSAEALTWTEQELAAMQQQLTATQGQPAGGDVTGNGNGNVAGNNNGIGNCNTLGPGHT
jgi:hypothetical protein